MNVLTKTIISKLNINNYDSISNISVLNKAELIEFNSRKDFYLKKVKEKIAKEKDEIWAQLKRKDKINAIADAKEWKLSLKQYLILKDKANRILKNFHTGHSMGCYRYLGINGSVFTSQNVIEEYAKTSKYKANHGALTLNLTLKELKAIELIGGVATLRTTRGKCIVFEQQGSKQSHRIERVEYFLIGTSHGKTLEEATNLERQKRRSENIRKVKENAFVGVNDIKKLGACEIGIDQFCQRNNINKDFGYRVDYLLNLNDSQNYFERLIN